MNPTTPVAPRPWSVAADTLVDLLQLRAAENGIQDAYTFLRDGETEEATWTYDDLAQRARSIAVQLRNHGVAPGDRAILLYPSGLDFIAGFFGCLAAGVIAVPCYPPGSPELAKRAAGIASNCGAKIALSTVMFKSLGDNPAGDLAWNVSRLLARTGGNLPNA